MRQATAKIGLRRFTRAKDPGIGDDAGGWILRSAETGRHEPTGQADLRPVDGGELESLRIDRREAQVAPFGLQTNDCSQESCDLALRLDLARKGRISLGMSFRLGEDLEEVATTDRRTRDAEPSREPDVGLLDREEMARARRTREGGNLALAMSHVEPLAGVDPVGHLAVVDKSAALRAPRSGRARMRRSNLAATLTASGRSAAALLTRTSYFRASRDIAFRNDFKNGAAVPRRLSGLDRARRPHRRAASRLVPPGGAIEWRTST